MAGTLDENLYRLPLCMAASTKERVAFAERTPLDIQKNPSKDLRMCSERRKTEQHQRQPHESPPSPPPQGKHQQEQGQLQRRQRQHHHCQQKVFVADDKFTDVIATLVERGWTRSSHANSPNFNLKWRNLSNINFRLLRNDQFVNHVFNSHQLSNKALLTGHLGFQHDHLRRLRQPQEVFDAPAAPICGADSTEFRSSSSSPSSSRGEGCSETNRRNASDLPPSATAAFEGALDAANPESFFPRCWDVSDDSDGLSSMLRGFAVSAAVALLRTAVQAQDSDRARRSQGSDKPGGGAAALASATSVTSRYISYLQSSRNVVSSKTPPTSTGSIVPDHGPAQPRAKMHVGLSCCGRDAADAAISVEDPDLMATLEAWEAATVAAASGTEEKAGVEMRENNHAGEAQPNSNTQKVGLVGKKESGSVAEEEEEEEEEGRAATKEGSNVASREDQKEKKGAMGSALERATKVLRTLDEEADVQAALCMGPANAWVVKPAGSSCGRGVEVVSTLRGLVSACQRLEWKAVVQKYVERPLLVQGYKFDIRQWVLVTSCNPLVVWGFDESYVRFSSRPFAMDAPSLSNRLVHLCNHSVQKEQASGVDTDCTSSPGGTKGDGYTQTGSQALPSGSQGNMWRADQLRSYLRQRFEGKDVFQDMVLPRIRSVVTQTLLAVREGLKMKGVALEWLGFDLMVTEDLRVMLIEVNVSPDVSHSTPVTARLVPDATNHALSLLLDDCGADARATSTPHREPSPSHLSSCKSDISTLVDDHTGVMPAEAAGPGSLAPQSCVRGRQEGKLGGLGKLRWRLWHQGEEESLTVLRSLREEKKAWFEARREKRQQRQGRRRASDSNGALSVDDDREMALGVVEGILNYPPRGDNCTSYCSRGDRPARREAGLLPPISCMPPATPRTVSPRLPTENSAPDRIAQNGNIMEECSSGRGRVIRLRCSVEEQPTDVEDVVNAGLDSRILNAGRTREEEAKQEEEEEEEL